MYKTQHIRQPDNPIGGIIHWVRSFAPHLFLLCAGGASLLIFLTAGAL